MALTPTFTVNKLRIDTEDEHQVGVAIWKTSDTFEKVDFFGMVVSTDANPRWCGLIMPLRYGEDFTNGWQDRIMARIEAYEEPCKCEITSITQFMALANADKCEYHKWLNELWAIEDEDAIDSWRESRGDVNALFRRIERKIKTEG